MKNKGQTTVETAFMIIVLFLLVFGITEFGRAMYIKNCLNNAARAAVRQAIVTRPLTDVTGITSAADQGFPDIQAKIFDSLFYMNKANVSATVDIIGKTGTQEASPNDTVTVQVTLTGFTSFVPRLITIGNTLVGTASMRYE